MLDGALPVVAAVSCLDVHFFFKQAAYGNHPADHLLDLGQLQTAEMAFATLYAISMTWRCSAGVVLRRAKFRTAFPLPRETQYGGGSPKSLLFHSSLKFQKIV